MGWGVPAHVHAEVILSALQEARPAGLTITRLMAATERTRAQIHTGSRTCAKSQPHAAFCRCPGTGSADAGCWTTRRRCESARAGNCGTEASLGVWSIICPAR
jgi:hypothetical protein